MALLTPSTKSEKAQIRINIDASIINKAKAYCEFAGIKKLDEFFEKAAEFVLAKDKGWQKRYAASESE